MADLNLLWVDPEADGVPESLAADPDVGVHRRDSVESAAAALEGTTVDCVVTSFDLPDGTGADLLAQVRERRPDVGCLLRTDADPARVAEAGPDSLVFEYVDDRTATRGERIDGLVRTTARRRTQTSYPVPEGERERLAALERYDLASAEIAAPLRRITHLAARHFDVVQSSVNTIGEYRQTFLACHADDWPEIPREDSICTFAILSEGVTVVEDVASDPRFAASETLEDLGIEFYAGATVVVEDDQPIGTVCVYDEAPRSFSAADESYLALLAEEAGDWFDRARVGEEGDREPRPVGGEIP